MSLIANLLLKPQENSIPNPDGAAIFPEAPLKRPPRSPAPYPYSQEPLPRKGAPIQSFLQGSLDFSFGPGYSSKFDRAAVNYGFQLGFGVHPWNWSTFVHVFNPPETSEILHPVGGEATVAAATPDSQEYLLWGLEAGYNLFSHHNHAGIFRIGLPLAWRRNLVSQDDALLMGAGFHYSGGFPPTENPSSHYRLPLGALSGKVLLSPFEDQIETILMLNVDLSVSTMAFGIGSLFSWGG